MEGGGQGSAKPGLAPPPPILNVVTPQQLLVAVMRGQRITIINLLTAYNRTLLLNSALVQPLLQSSKYFLGSLLLLLSTTISYTTGLNTHAFTLFVPLF